MNRTIVYAEDRRDMTENWLKHSPLYFDQVARFLPNPDHGDSAFFCPGYNSFPVPLAKHNDPYRKFVEMGIMKNYYYVLTSKK